MSGILEHHDEPEPGIPAPLPASERVLWRGQPDWKVLARTKFHVLKLAAYFAIVVISHQVVQLSTGTSLLDSLSGGMIYLVLASVAVGLVALFAWGTARATVFTVTNRRLIIRCGIALPLSMNLPFSKVDTAEFSDLGNGFGNIALKPTADSRASYVLLWPYVRPWRLSRVQPMLRALPDAEYVADKLGKALEADAIERSSRPPLPVAAPQRPRPDDAGEPRKWKPYPTIPLATAVGLVVLTVVSTALVSFTGNKPAAEPPTNVVASVDLRFEDLDDGSINVIDASDDSVIETLVPGTNGFLRSTLRGLARARKLAGEGDEVAFLLQQTAEGRLLLTDPVTERSVDLWAFGSVNARNFVRFLPAVDNRTASNHDLLKNQSSNSAPTTVALTNQELSQ